MKFACDYEEKEEGQTKSKKPKLKKQSQFGRGSN
jgi:hypothetical protein